MKRLRRVARECWKVIALLTASLAVASWISSDPLGTPTVFAFGMLVGLPFAVVNYVWQVRRPDLPYAADVACVAALLAAGVAMWCTR